jgi:hypothetical protein
MLLIQIILHYLALQCPSNPYDEESTAAKDLPQRETQFSDTTRNRVKEESWNQSHKRTSGVRQYMSTANSVRNTYWQRM